MMNKLLLLLILGVALAILRVVAIALAALVLVTLLVAFITRPRQTLVFLGTLALSALTVAQPIACIIAVTTVAIVVVVARRRRRPKPYRQHLLTDID